MTHFFRHAVAVAMLACATAAGAQPEPPAAAKPVAPPTEHLPLGARSAPAQVPAVPPPTTAGATIQTALALGAVVTAIIIIGAVVRAVARRSGGLQSALGAGGRSPSGVLEALGRFPVSRGTTLLLLKLDRRVLLVSHCTGRGGGSMSTLAEVSDPEEVASILLKTRDEEGASLAQRFQGVLAREGAEVERALTPHLASQQPPHMVQPIARARPAVTPAPGVNAVRARLAGLRRGLEVRA